MSMRLFLGGFFTYYLPPQKRKLHYIDIELKQTTPLAEVLQRVGIPEAEVHLVALNGQAVEPANLMVNPEDEVRIYPPIGGG